jgi:hypothetical protein
MVNEHGRSIVAATIEIDGDADPPEGRLVAYGSIFEFRGWLGLALALEGAIDAARQVAPADDRRRRDHA